MTPFFVDFLHVAFMYSTRSCLNGIWMLTTFDVTTLQTDVVTSNGVRHHINKVLFPNFLRIP
jgi:hypothetical protein